MISTTQLSNEFSQTTNTWGFQPISVTASSVTGICYAHITIDMGTPALIQVEAQSAVAISDLISERERDPRKAAALARARQKLASRLTDDLPLSLARLRLQKGLSQARLASLMGLQQPYIARIERGEDDLKISTIENLAKALGESTAAVFAAVAERRAEREASA
ncbi:helix-turn-helix domain-containing protein [Herminiimonas sp. CN]|uniref:helix-turn-helix domain-containing protein n=1 Tax=Herminiimonas sp. CN TaxID=1349818 RepID=UPI0009DF9A10|nr:helix-turn-helix transcriptional regulator [Herminiimonas sp. CN]